MKMTFWSFAIQQRRKYRMFKALYLWIFKNVLSVKVWYCVCTVFSVIVFSSL